MMTNLTTKELSGIEDQLNCEKILIEKYKAYADATLDGALKQKLCEISNKHLEHYNKLTGLLG